jgi:hypothetical protein
MPVFYPDILEHNNSNRALVDITELRGNAYPINQLSDTGSIPADKRKVGAIVFVTSSGAFYGFSGTTSSLWNDPTKWGSLGGGSGVTGGATNYVAVWAGSTSLTTGSLYNDRINNRIGVNKSDPSYALDVNGDFRVSGSSVIIYHQKNQTGVVLPTTIANGGVETLLSFNLNEYRGLFLNYELELSSRTSRSGTLKATIYAIENAGIVYTAIQSNETTTQEYHFLTDSSPSPTTTENVTFTLDIAGSGVELRCNNAITASGITATVQGEWKLISNT